MQWPKKELYQPVSHRVVQLNYTSSNPLMEVSVTLCKGKVRLRCLFYLHYRLQSSSCVCICLQGRRQRGPGPPFGIGAPPFYVWPTGCCIHPILYFKNVPPLLFFGPSCWFLAPPAAKFWRRACLSVAEMIG